MQGTHRDMVIDDGSTGTTTLCESTRDESCISVRRNSRLQTLWRLSFRRHAHICNVNTHEQMQS